VEVLSVDKRKDIALLKIQAVELPYLALGRSGAVEIGDTIYSVSNPLGTALQNTLSQGLVSGKRDMEGYRVLQISAPISHGSSGGPIFNTAAEVVGSSGLQF
jgi:serine protease Do